MAKIDYSYVEEEVLYDSGIVENELLDIYKNKEQPDIERYFYSVIDIRENILNWYPFKKECTILEIGGGLGSITGCLCKNAEKVVSCEYSKRRAEVLYHRHKDQKNLEVVVGNLKKIKFNQKFDYIILVGVFEYAKRFYKSHNSFNDFLDDIKKLLNPKGVILIAIENRYGIKYIAGAKEDHYESQYTGLYGYDNLDIQTFGKDELINIIKKSGFKHYKFYYPYPDYKMPYVIYTDQRLPLKTELPTLNFYNHGNEIYNFDYRKVLAGIIENNHFGFFANSFLLEITNSSSSISDVIYAKTTWHRSKKYQVYTIINNNNLIIKYPKYPEACMHLDNMIVTHQKLKELELNVCNITKDNNKYMVEYIEGENLYEYINELSNKKEKLLIINELDKYYDLLKSISYYGKIKKFASNEEKEFFNEKEIYILKINVFDLQLANIIKNNNRYYIIDQEWVSEFCIPLNYMMYYSIFYLFNWVNGISDLFTQQELYDKYQITNKEIDVYNSMSEIFSNEEFVNVDKKVYKIILQQNNFFSIDDYINQMNVLKETEISQIKEAKEKEITIIKEEKEKEITQIKCNSEKQINYLNEKIENIYNSTSWRITYSLRLIKQIIHRYFDKRK